MAENTRKGRAAKPSIASHPLFPVIVVLWFGALFGLASLALRPALMEGFVAATGIDRVVPMAAPPLGNTARLLIVLLMTILGCLVGAVVARRVARPVAQPAARRRRPAPETESADEGTSPVGMFGSAPSVADDEEEGVEQPVRRRRQLALLPHDEAFDDQAPLPGTQILSVAELPLKSFDEVDGIWLHNSDRPEPRGPMTLQLQAKEDGSAELPHDDDRLEPFAPIAPEIAAQDAHDETDGRSNRLFESYVRRVNAGVGSNDSDLPPTPGFASIPPSDAEDRPTVPDEAPAALNEPAYANTAERIANAPLDALSHVELLERLAQTIARRRARWAQTRERSADDAEAAALTPRLETAPPAEPARFAKPQSLQAEMPAALRPGWADHDDTDDDALPSTIPPRSIAMKPQPTPSEQADDEDILAEGYSSLRGMTKQAPHQFVRIDESENSAVPQPPIVAFPGLQDASTASQPDRRAFDSPRGEEPAADQTEQALRAALATLRRMSGAA